MECKYVAMGRIGWVTGFTEVHCIWRKYSKEILQTVQYFMLYIQIYFQNVFLHNMKPIFFL